jgi:cupin 2 domain-containing protein
VNGNLFDGSIPRDHEFIEVLWQSSGVRVERIVSHGQASPPGHWYDQDTDEWVAVLAGKAALRIEGRDDLLVLGPGDQVFLPAHRRHRVEWTAQQVATIWLAVHSWAV